MNSISNVISHNNRRYIIPNVNTNNKQNFDVLKGIFLQYTYIDFLNNFETIYNNSDDYNKRACFWIYSICSEYTKVKSQNKSLDLTKIIQHLINEGTKKYRLNNRVFHLNYIGFILYWKYYKINYEDCNTVDKFNKILSELRLPSNLTTGFPLLLKDFDNSFADVMKDVIQSNKEYYQQKNELELIELDKKFRVEFNKRFNKYKSYISRLREEMNDMLDYSVYETLFIDYYSNCDIAIANEIIYNSTKNEYNKLSKKYRLVKVDYKTNIITKWVFYDLSYYVKIGLDIKHDKRAVADAITKDFNKKCIVNYNCPEYRFNSIEHHDLILSLIK